MKNIHAVLRAGWLSLLILGLSACGGGGGGGAEEATPQPEPVPIPTPSPVPDPAPQARFTYKDVAFRVNISSESASSENAQAAEVLLNTWGQKGYRLVSLYSAPSSEDIFEQYYPPPPGVWTTHLLLAKNIDSDQTYNYVLQPFFMSLNDPVTLDNAIANFPILGKKGYLEKGEWPSDGLCMPFPMSYKGLNLFEKAEKIARSYDIYVSNPKNETLPDPFEQGYVPVVAAKTFCYESRVVFAKETSINAQPLERVMKSFTHHVGWSFSQDQENEKRLFGENLLALCNEMGALGFRAYGSRDFLSEDKGHAIQEVYFARDRNQSSKFSYRLISVPQTRMEFLDELEKQGQEGYMLLARNGVTLFGETEMTTSFFLASGKRIILEKVSDCQGLLCDSIKPLGIDARL